MGAQELCQRHPYVIEPFFDGLGLVGVSVLVDGQYFYLSGESDDRSIREILSGPQLAICYDLRHFQSFDIPRRVRSVRLLYGGDDDLVRLSRRISLRYSEALKKFTLHLKVCKTAKIDVGRFRIEKLVPPAILDELLRAKVEAIRGLHDLKERSDLLHREMRMHEEETVEFARALYAIEESGIKIDVPYVDEQLKLEHPVATKKLFRSMRDTQRGGFVKTRFNPCGGKTGRIRVEGGFNCMSIPHGPARNAIISRWDGGKICVFDYNAIDYRCIVQSVGDRELSGLYDDCPDFHNRTTELLFGPGAVTDLRRDIIKKITYIYIYGGSRDTLQVKTSLSEAKLDEVLTRLDRFLSPIKEFRSELYAQATRDGYVTLPTGRQILVEKDSHEGKVLGLFAQGFSSYVFEKALVTIQKGMTSMKSRIIFTVHDEVVVDMDPDELYRGPEIRDTLELAVPNHDFRVSMKVGKSYGEATAKGKRNETIE